MNKYEVPANIPVKTKFKVKNQIKAEILKIEGHPLEKMTFTTSKEGKTKKKRRYIDKYREIFQKGEKEEGFNFDS